MFTTSLAPAGIAIAEDIAPVALADISTESPVAEGITDEEAPVEDHEIPPEANASVDQVETVDSEAAVREVEESEAVGEDAEEANADRDEDDELSAIADDSATAVSGDAGVGSAGALIETGDASAETDISNTVNTNMVDQSVTAESESSGISETSEDGAGEVSDPTISAEDANGLFENPSNTSINTTNDATVENTATTTADTGGNAASGGGSVTVVSGDSYAVTNVVNVVNTNIVNSNAFFLLLNALFGSFGNLDLRDLLPGAIGMSNEGQNLCGMTCLFSSLALFGNLSINSSSTATIGNNIVARSSTGENSLLSEAGDVAIETGNAFAGVNVLNVANTNIVDSNYLLVSINNFGGWGGDLVLPGKDFFQKLFFGEPGGVSGNVTVANDNEVSIENGVSVDAQTGDNSASSTLGASIESGQAAAHAQTVNQANGNFFGTDSLIIAFRIHGNWSGDIFSAPEGLAWNETDDGLILIGNLSGIPEPDVFPGSGEMLTAHSGALGGASTTIANQNIASIKNNIKVLALTGGNRVEGAGGTAGVATGNAYAGVNLLNIANTNVVGSNMVLALINIFGDWTGNLAFGRPDLWVGGYASTPNSRMGPGDLFTYHFSVANRGDADATHVALTTTANDDLLWFSSGEWSPDGTEISWDLGTIPIGEVRDVSFEGSVRQHIPEGTWLVNSEVTADGYETDANILDNTETIALEIYKEQAQSSGPPGIWYTPPPDLVVRKSNSASSTIQAPESVSYEIVIENNGQGSAYHGELVDTLKDSKGNIVHEESWPLEEIFSGEEIIITYSLEFSASTTPDEYVNYAQVKAYGGNPSLEPFYGTVADSNIATSSVYVTTNILRTEDTPLQEQRVLVDIEEPVEKAEEVSMPDDTAANAVSLLEENDSSDMIDGNLQEEERVDIKKSAEIIPRELLAAMLRREARGDTAEEGESDFLEEAHNTSTVLTAGTQTAAVLGADVSFSLLWLIPLMLFVVFLGVYSETRYGYVRMILL